MKSNISLYLLSALLLIGLPLIGSACGDADILSYLEFPPLTRYVAHAPFNPLVFIIIGTVDVLMVFGVLSLFKAALKRSGQSLPDHRSKGLFPVWGGLGMIVMLVGWVLAWTRFPWFAPLQAHTFYIPWIGYILLVNALCVARSGRSPLTEAPSRFLWLWPASALFWWFFEYLNRFVQNWYYVGVRDFSPWAYVLHSSLAFATVLPAVLSTLRLLLTFRVFNTGLKSLYPLTALEDKRTAGPALFIAGFGLAFIGGYPDYLFPLVWVAPLLVITSLQTLLRKSTLFAGLKTGDWRAIIASATAALICGFFWELWNYQSLARWEYAIPFVDRFHIFAMPVLGYGGYLPFGLECLLVGQMILGRSPLMLPDAGEDRYHKSAET